MPRRFTMSELRTRCLQQCDLDKDAAFTSDTSLVNAMMSAQYAQLWAIVDASGHRYFETSVQLTTTGTNTLAEPVDHLGTIDTIERIVDTTSGGSSSWT